MFEMSYMCEMFDRQLNFLQKNTIPTAGCTQQISLTGHVRRPQRGGSNWGSVEVIDLEDLYWWGCVVGDDVVMM